MTSILTSIALNQEVPKNQWDHFELGTKLVLAKWTALRMAMEGGWGGGDISRKYEIFVDEILNLFKYHKNIYVNDLIENMEEYLDSEFGLICEDGSVEEVSNILLQLAQDCKNGNFLNVMKWKDELNHLTYIDLKKSKVIKPQDCVQVNNTNIISNTNIENKNIHINQVNNEEDNGWSTVVRKSTRKKNQTKFYDPQVVFPGA